MITLPPQVVIPREDSYKLLGIQPTVITIDDMTSKYAYYRLAVMHDPGLEQRDFVDVDTYIKYSLLALGLMDYPVILIGGEPGGGKSLFEAWYTRQGVRLFGKRATLDWTPPRPELFGNYHNLFDQDFVDLIMDEFDRLATMEKETGREVPLEIRQQMITFNAVVGLEECDGYLHRQSQTNLTKFIAMLARRRRHVFMCMAAVLVDIQEFAPVFYKLHTHIVDCIWQGHFKDHCSIYIKDDRKGGTGLSKWLWLKPEDWEGLWYSHNIPPLSHDVEIHFGNKGKKDREKRRLERQLGTDLVKAQEVQ